MPPRQTSSMLLLFLFLFLGRQHLTRGHELLGVSSEVMDAAAIGRMTTMLDEAISLDATPKALSLSGSWVTVSWQGVTNPTPTDFVVAYAPPADGNKNEEAPPPPPDPSQLAPIKYQYAAVADPRHLESGCGQVKFKLVALSSDYRFGFCRGNASMGIVAAWSDTVSVGKSGGGGGTNMGNAAGETAAAAAAAASATLMPLQLHLALTGKPSEMRITWKTSGLEARAAGAQQVLYAKANEPVADTSSIWTSTAASSLTFEKDDLCGEPAQTVGFLAPGYVHTAIMRGLEPETTYMYKVGDPVQDTYSSTYSFRTGPLIRPLPAGVISQAQENKEGPVLAEEEDGATAGKVRIAVFGDMSSAEEDGSLQVGWFANDWESIDTAQTLTHQVMAGDIDLAMCVGDLSYASGFLSRWDSWLDQMEPVAARVPLMTTPGNHERDDPHASSFYTTKSSNTLYVKNDGGGECGVPYQVYFPMPGPSNDPKGDQPWYSFDYGPMHVTVASTEHDFRQGSTQYAWFAQDLANVDREVTPWLVFVGHRPFYVDSTDDPDPTDPLSPSEQGAARLLRAHLEPLLIKHHVDLCLAGHHHSYQRTCKVAGGECVAEAGYQGTLYKAPVHVLVGMAGRRLSVNFMPETPVFFESVVRDTFGTTLLEATPSRLVLTFRDSANDQIVDQTVLHAPLEHRIHQEEQTDDEAYHKSRHNLPPSIRKPPQHLVRAAAIYWVFLILGLALFLGSVLAGGRFPGWWLWLRAAVAGSGTAGGGHHRFFSRDKHDMSPAPLSASEMTPLTGSSSLDGSGSASKRYRTGSMVKFADAV